MHADTGTNIVDVYINYLRRKIDADASHSDLIETVRGMGYRLGGLGRKPMARLPGRHAPIFAPAFA